MSCEEKALMVKLGIEESVTVTLGGIGSYIKMVRVLTSLFLPFLLDLYRMLITPRGGGKFAAMMVVNVINLPDGSSRESGVLVSSQLMVSVEKCKYLEECKCVGICVNTCKLPTQTFFKHFMGIPLLMEPNFTDYSCQ
ncbi:Beta-carotene isomerase D27, chloroplastic-like protein, partial [Drosera capensis]